MRLGFPGDWSDWPVRALASGVPDIKMPGMQYLNLSDVIDTTTPAIKAAFLSGFEPATEALTFRVFDPMRAPVRYEDLIPRALSSGKIEVLRTLKVGIVESRARWLNDEKTLIGILVSWRDLSKIDRGDAAFFFTKLGNDPTDKRWWTVAVTHPDVAKALANLAAFELLRKL